MQADVLQGKNLIVPLPTGAVSYTHLIIRPDGREEEIDDICEAVTDVFSNVGRLGSSQRRILSETCYKAIENLTCYSDDMKCLYASLAVCEEEARCV